MVKTNTDQSYKAPITIGAFGKRSNLDKMLSRNFITKKSPWLGVKAHYAYDDFPDHLVGLHSFEGGYGGLSKTETGAVNFCYLATYESFQKKQNIEDFNTLVVSQNPYLANFLKKAIIIFDRPLSIAQISFEEKEPVEDHVIMCGDSAGLIHPLCGNGMAMAIHSAKIASELIHAYLHEASSDRNRLEKEYALKWQRTFGKRIRTGRRLQKLLMSPKLADILFSLAVLSPGILRRIIKRTHGKPIEL
jgi:flavin-dependent dehydrogenase